MAFQGQKRSPLLALPSELIDEIFSYFTPERDFEADWRIKGAPIEQYREDRNKRGRATLRKLCLVSKDVHRHAELALYSWVGVLGSPPDTKQLCAVLFKTSSNPRLAQSVKYVEYFSDRDDHQMLGAINEPEIRLAVETIAAETKGTEKLAQWRELFKLHVNASLVALILEHSSSLQHLSLTDRMQEMVQRDTPDPYRVFGASLVPHFHFPKLQVLCLSLMQGSTAGDLSAFIRNLQTLPQLRYLKLDCGGVGLNEADEKVTLEFPALRTIILYAFGGSPKILANFIDGCHELQNISWPFFTSDHDGDRTLSADLSAMERALEKHHASLRTLEIRLGFHHHRGRAAPLARLANFPNLTKLTIDTVSLLGAPWSPNATSAESRWWYENTHFRLSQRLPPNIVELSLYNYHYFEDGVLVLRDLAEDCERLPHLKTVRKSEYWLRPRIHEVQLAWRIRYRESSGYALLTLCANV